MGVAGKTHANAGLVLGLLVFNGRKNMQSSKELNAGRQSNKITRFPQPRINPPRIYSSSPTHNNRRTQRRNKGAMHLLPSRVRVSSTLRPF